MQLGGPYPKKSPEHELESESLDRFRGAVGTKNFEIRDERISDAGVDLSLELTPDGVFLNMRSQVQIKATASQTLNIDGSHSFSVDVSNINYLLNGGQSPMYVLYLKAQGELRYAWARDEALRLDAENADWMEQSSVTFRFTKKLDTVALQDITKRIFDESSIHRAVFEKLDAVASRGLVDLRIDPSTLKVQSSDQALALVMQEGLELVASGHASELLQILRTIAPDQVTDQRVQLVSAYAHASLGRYPEAMGAVSSARLSGTLDEDEGILLDSISDACELQTGRIDVSTYAANEEARSDKAGSDFALTLKMESLRYKLLDAPSQEEKEALMTELRHVGDRIESRRAEEPRMAMQKDAVLLHGEGVVLVGRVLHMLAGSNVRAKAMLGSDRAEDAKEVLAIVEDYENRVGTLLESGSFSSHPSLEADLRTTRFMVRMLTLHSLIAFSDALAAEPPGLFADAIRVEEIAASSGDLQLSSRIKLLAANLHDLFGRPDEALRLANLALPVAKALQLSNLVEDAQDILAGRSLAAGLRALKEQAKNADPDELLATMTDEEAENYASDMLGLLRLPADRSANVLVEVNANRKAAQLKNTWCRHLRLRVRNEDKNSPETAYRDRGSFKCHCVAKNLQSSSASDNASQLFDSFISGPCSGCDMRHPLSERLQS